MVTLARAQRLNIPAGPLIGMAGGTFLALLCLVMPGSILERLVAATGIAAMVAAAEPPLGFTARIALGLILGGGFAGVVGVGLSLLGERPFEFAKAAALLRRGDVHPDGPPRPPLFAARDLGTPFLDVKAPVEEPALDLSKFEPEPPVEQPLPRDLDQPLAAFDPAALQGESRPAPAPIPRPALIDPGDRIETFELTPVGRSAVLSLRAPAFAPAEARPAAPVAAPPIIDRVVAPETEASVHDLLARLERGLGCPAESAAPIPGSAGGLASTLGDLRRMATEGR